MPDLVLYASLHAGTKPCVLVAPPHGVDRILSNLHDLKHVQGAESRIGGTRRIGSGKTSEPRAPGAAVTCET